MAYAAWHPTNRLWEVPARMETIRERFLTWLREKRELSWRTLREYNRCLVQIYSAANDDILAPVRSQRQFEELIEKLSNRQNWKQLTKYRCSKVLEWFLDYCVRQEVIKKNPYKNPYRKGRPKEPRYLTENDFKKILMNPHNTLMEIVILQLLWDTGIRRSELVRIKFGDIDLKERTIQIFEEKKDQNRLVPISIKTKRILLIYISFLRQQIDVKDNTPMIITREMTQYSENGLYKQLRLIGKRVGIYLHPHMLRHSLSARMIESGYDLSIASRLLGHSNLAQTYQYTHYPSKTLKKIKDQFDKQNFY